MNKDDGVRASKGIVVCARKLPDGCIRLIMDNVESASQTINTQWRNGCFYTHTYFDANEFVGGKIPEDKLADIGLAIVANLAVHLKKGDNGT